MSIVAPSVQLKVEALTDCWKFFDLINYHGGSSNFDSCHYDFLLVLQAPQLRADGLLVGDTLSRWQSLVGLECSVPPHNRFLKYPRGHLKSTLIVGWLLYRIYRNPNITCAFATNVKELSEAFIRELRSHLEDETLQETVWNLRPHIQGNLIPPLDKSQRRSAKNESDDKKIVWSLNQLQVMRSRKCKEPTVYSTSVESKLTGHHYDLIICDDIVDFTNSVGNRNNSVKRWCADASSVINRVPQYYPLGMTPDGTAVSETLGGEFVITGTHYSPTDYYSFLDQNTEDLGYAKLSRNIYANGEDSSGGYLWGRFTESMELRLRAELQEQPGVFEAQYLNFVNNPALQILSTSLVQYVPHQVLIDGITDQGLVFQDPETGLQEFVTPIIAVDPAISLRSSADYTAIAVGGYTSGGKLLVNDLSVGHFTPEFTVKEVVRLVKLWKVRLVYVETVGFQRLLYDQVLKAIISEGLRCGVLSYTPKGNKLKRIEVQLSALFNEGNVIFSERMRVSPLIMNTFDYFGRGGRDDPPDAVAVIAEKTRPRKLERITSLSTHRYPFTPTATHSFNSHFGGIY